MTAIDSHEVRRILAERRITMPEDDRDEIALDSLSLAWILHSLTAELRVDLDPDDADVAMFRSVRGIVDYLNMALSAAGRHDP